jgi:hypothetical protein
MVNNMRNSCWIVLCVAVSLTLSIAARAQAADQDDTNSEIEALRADLRANKVEIIKDNMQFSEKESAVFWPIYNKYEADLAKLNDERVQLIKSYADKYGSMTDADAKTLADKSFDLQLRLVDLRKKYFKEFNKQLPATTVARFFQLEHRLDLLIDLKLASVLPPLQKKAVQSTSSK